MKKIVALALSLIMVLGLATTAFAAIPVWTQNGAIVDVDLFDGQYNTKVATGEMVFTAAKAPVDTNKDGVTDIGGNIAYYRFTDATNGDVTSDYEATFYVVVPSIPVDANADNYVLVKVADPTVEIGKAVEANQTAANQVKIMKMVTAVEYAYSATLFTSWGDLCGQYKAPVDVATQKYVAYNAAKQDFVAAANVDYVNNWWDNVLVGNDVYTVIAAPEAKIAHAWVPTAWNDKTGAVTEFTCETCKTVAKVINASVNAPAGSTVENLNGTLIAFNYTVGVKAPASSTVQSAQTFDAGIAMYVGMSVMAAAGSAVVLKKKD